MKKNVLFFISIVLLCIAGWGFYLYNKPRQSIGNVSPDVIIAATDLYREYSNDEAKANRKYVNKIIAVNGVVAGIYQTDSTCLIQLQGGDTGGISCDVFTQNRNNFSLKTGDSLLVKGRCTGFLMDVALTDCVIEK